MIMIFILIQKMNKLYCSLTNHCTLLKHQPSWLFRHLLTNLQTSNQTTLRKLIIGQDAENLQQIKKQIDKAQVQI